MSQSVICPNCQSSQSVEEPAGETQRVIWCKKCRFPTKMQAKATTTPRCRSDQRTMAVSMLC